MTKPNVVIVGAGVTGSVLAKLVKDMGFPVKVLEKSRGAGGRMSTHRFRGGSGSRQDPIIGRADLGAQYITTRAPPDDAVMGPIYDGLVGAGVLRLFTGEVAGPNPYGGAGPEVRHFSAPLGLQSVAEHFLASSGVEVRWDAYLKTLDVQSDGGVGLGIFKGTDGSPVTGEGGDGAPTVVVLTQPVSQVLGGSKFGLSGNFVAGLAPETASALSKVEYSSRFAMAYLFDNADFSWPYSWTAHYFDKGDVRYVSHDTGKRGATAEEPTVSVIVHSGVPLGIELKDEAGPFEGAAARMRADIQQKLPEVPWAKAEAAGRVKVHKWLYSQVYKGVDAKRPSPDWVWGSDDKGFPGCLELFQSGRSLGLLAGDATAPAGNFEGCVFSAHRTAEAIRAFAEKLSSQSAEARRVEL